MSLMRLRPDPLRRVEQAFVDLFSSPRPFPRVSCWFVREWGEKNIVGSLAICPVLTTDGDLVHTLVYGADGYPTPVPGWQNRPPGEIEEGLEAVVRGITVVNSPLTFAQNPAALNPQWEGWGPGQIAMYLEFFGYIGSQLQR